MPQMMEDQLPVAAAPQQVNATPMPPAPMPTFTPAPFDFAPRNLTEAMELSRLLAESTMVPKQYMSNPGNCFIAMQWGAELSPPLKPMQALQNIAIIGNKPAIWGDAGKALLIANGCHIQEMDTDAIKAASGATCTITRVGRQPVTRTFTITDAQTAGLWVKDGPWKTYPYRQLAWRAFWFAARDAAPDILKGMPAAEELRDMEIDVTPPREAAPAEPVVKKSAKLAERLIDQKEKKLLEQVIDAFGTATTDTFDAAKAMAAKLTAKADKEIAAAAAKQALQRLKDEKKKEQEAPPAPTVADVSALLAKATSRDDVQVAGSMIDKVDTDVQLREALRADYHAVLAKFPEA